MPLETWRPIPGHSAVEVSDLGQIRYASTGQPYSTHRCCGYIHVSGFGRYRAEVGLARLVLLAFVGPAPEGMICRHLNGIRDDNRLENLRWGTKGEDLRDRHYHMVFGRSAR